MDLDIYNVVSVIVSVMIGYASAMYFEGERRKKELRRLRAQNNKEWKIRVETLSKYVKVRHDWLDYGNTKEVNINNHLVVRIQRGDQAIQIGDPVDIHWEDFDKKIQELTTLAHERMASLQALEDEYKN